MSTVDRVVVVGGGTMGRGIAHVFALHGRKVLLVDVSSEVLDRARASIARNLERQVAKGRVEKSAAQAALERVETRARLEEAAEEAQLAVEAVPEVAALKHEVFGILDRHAPEDAVLASNTSSISITALAGRTADPGRVVGMHFMNPVPVMELVEVVRGAATTDRTVDTVMALARELGKTPVEVNDAPGFVSNRVLMPMINEAAFALMEGVAEPEAIDTVMTLGMNHPMGPLALADLIGLDTCLNILEVLHAELGDDKYRPCPLLRRHVAAGWLGRKSGRGFYEYQD